MFQSMTVTLVIRIVFFLARRSRVILRRRDRFVRHLFAATHVSIGMPARGEESRMIRWADTAAVLVAHRSGSSTKDISCVLEGDAIVKFVWVSVRPFSQAQVQH